MSGYRNQTVNLGADYKVKVYQTDDGGTVQTMVLGTASGGAFTAADSSNPLPVYLSNAQPSTVYLLDEGANASISLGLSNSTLMTRSMSDRRSFSAQIAGTWTGTILFQGSNDNNTWVPIILKNASTGALVTQTTANGIFSGSTGFGYIRIRTGTISSGTPDLTWYAFVFNNEELRDPLLGNSTFATAQISVASTATLICAANTSRRRIVITAIGTTDAYIGGSGVTTSTGQLLVGTKGSTVTIETTAAVYGITASGTQSVSYLEEYN